MPLRRFLNGAALLMLAGLAAKILGFYRLLLPRLMGATGVGLYHVAYPVYALLITLTTGGVPLAISKAVAEAVADGDRDRAHAIFRGALRALGLLGLLGSGLLFWYARPLADQVARDPQAVYALQAVAPAVWVVALLSAYRGFFQGLQEMGAPAVSLVVEQAVRVGTLFLLIVLLLPFGVAMAAAGATFGAVTGGAAALFYLAVVMHRWERRHRPSRRTLPVRTVLVPLALTALPIAASSLFFPVMQIVDLWLVPSGLAAQGVPSALATAAYGRLAGYAMPLVALPAIFTGALATALLPAVAESHRSRQWEERNGRIRAGLRLALLFALPTAVGMLVLADPMTHLLFNTHRAGGLLALLTPTAFAFSLGTVVVASLQGMERLWHPLWALLAGAGIKVLATLIWLPRFGTMGAALATSLAACTTLLWNLGQIGRCGFRLGPLGGLFFRTLLAAGVMAAGVLSAYRYLAACCGQVPALIGAITAGVLLYLTGLWLLGEVTSGDVSLVPGVGPRLSALLRRWGILQE